MNTRKITVTAITALIAATASLADSSRPTKDRPTPASIVASMIGSHDQDHDGALNNVELAKSIDALYAKRNQAIRNHREAMIEKGLITSDISDNGFITLSPMPEDAAAFLLKGHDTNANQILEADELLASTRDLRQLNLGFRPSFARKS